MPIKASNSRKDSLERAGGPPNSPYRGHIEKWVVEEES
jgi:hypothetical protein